MNLTIWSVCVSVCRHGGAEQGRSFIAFPEGLHQSLSFSGFGAASLGRIWLLRLIRRSNRWWYSKHQNIRKFIKKESTIESSPHIFAVTRPLKSTADSGQLDNNRGLVAIGFQFHGDAGVEFEGVHISHPIHLNLSLPKFTILNLSDIQWRSKRWDLGPQKPVSCVKTKGSWGNVKKRSLWRGYETLFCWAALLEPVTWGKETCPIQIDLREPGTVAENHTRTDNLIRSKGKPDFGAWTFKGRTNLLHGPAWRAAGHCDRLRYCCNVWQ